MAEQQVADIVSLDRYRRLRSSSDRPEPIIAQWKCRVGICMVHIGVTQTALDTLAMFNAELRRRREKPIAENDVMVCADHQNHLLKSRW